MEGENARGLDWLCFLRLFFFVWLAVSVRSRRAVRQQRGEKSLSRVVSEIDDLHSGNRWILSKAPDHPGGPGRMTRVSNLRAFGAEGVKGDGRIPDASSRCHSAALGHSQRRPVDRRGELRSGRGAARCHRVGFGGLRRQLQSALGDRGQSCRGGRLRCGAAPRLFWRRGRGHDGRMEYEFGPFACWLQWQRVCPRMPARESRKSRTMPANPRLRKQLCDAISKGCGPSRRRKSGRRVRSGARKDGWCDWAPTPRRCGCTMWSRSWSAKVWRHRPTAR